MSTIIEAKIIADSLSPSGVRLTTIQGICPRFIWPEVLTHRVFSRNAQSNRAIPTSRILEDVRLNPVEPLHWGKNEPGMQAYNELYEDLKSEAMEWWNIAKNHALTGAESLFSIGLHKQIANRVLEPFQHIRFIITATEWSNFLTLRTAPDAEPHIRALAVAIQEELLSKQPRPLLPGDWHLPYTSEEDFGAAVEDGFDAINIQTLIECSVARCARVSYNNHDNSKPDIEKDRKLFSELLKSKHLSPFEHQAIPMMAQGNRWEQGVTHRDRYDTYWSANFRGFRQYRQMIDSGIFND
jgi:thymidylate synthase ThyX